MSDTMTKTDNSNHAPDDETKRDFIYIATGAVAAAGALWRGKPVFVRHRTAAEIAEAEGVDVSDCPDPEMDADRLVPKPDGAVDPRFLVMVGVCTHFGCIPLGEAGDFNGWYCPCHGSHYDTSGRIRKGPAPKNMEIPSYTYISDTVIKVG